MDVTNLGRLVRIDAREVWKHEALSFTPWLRDNIGLLGEALGLDLEVAAEVSVGAFSVDLPARTSRPGGHSSSRTSLSRPTIATSARC